MKVINLNEVVDFLKELKTAYEKYRSIAADYEYHLKEGGDSNYTYQQYNDAYNEWEKVYDKIDNFI